MNGLVKIGQPPGILVVRTGARIANCLGRDFQASALAKTLVTSLENVALAPRLPIPTIRELGHVTDRLTGDRIGDEAGVNVA
jgi:hypothetical protein